MRFLERVPLALAGLVFVVSAWFCLLAALGLPVDGLVVDFLRIATEQAYYAGLAALILLLLGGHLLGRSCAGLGGRRPLLKENPMGYVSISLTALEDLVGRSARAVRACQGVQSRISQTEAGLKVDLQLKVLPGSSVEEIKEEITRRVQEVLFDTLGPVVSTIGVDLSEQGSSRGTELGNG